jgi:hypothetical protein
VVQEDGPVVARDRQFSVPQFLLRPVEEVRKSLRPSIRQDRLVVRPIHASGAQQSSRAFVVEAAVNLDVPGQRRIEGLSSRGDPVKDCAFQALCVIRSSTGCAFLDLRDFVNWDATAKREERGQCRTRSATKATSSSELPMIRSSMPGIMWSNFVKTRCSRLSLRHRDEEQTRKVEE